MQAKVKDIAKFISGDLTGDGEALINGISGIEEAKIKELEKL